ncbi:UNVERIFIED_CONTAM: Ataxin-3 [Siphonaria sp. JEL0065]|nr:Ataxin-3 [Siphonaria sp. JEL0065]
MDLINLGIVFWEKQEGQLCAQHALNAVLQGPYFSAVDLSQIARDLDAQELEALADGATTPPTPNTRSKFESQNYDDSGFFSLQVLEKALAVWNLTLTQLTSPNLKSAKEDPASQNAYILNLNEHWLTLRRFGGSRNRWYNLDSTLDGPKYISEFYLQALLAELGAQGYSIFVVGGDLMSCDADSYSLSCPVPPPSATPSNSSKGKEESKGVQAFSGRGYSLGGEPSGQQPGNGSNDSLSQDPELAAALAMSMEAGAERDQEELQKALAMSMENDLKRPAESDLDVLRRKRLEALNKRYS